MALPFEVFDRTEAGRDKRVATFLYSHDAAAYVLDSRYVKRVKVNGRIVWDNRKDRIAAGPHSPGAVETAAKLMRERVQQHNREYMARYAPPA